MHLAPAAQAGDRQVEGYVPPDLEQEHHRPPALGCGPLAGLRGVRCRIALAVSWPRVRLGRGPRRPAHAGRSARDSSNWPARNSRRPECRLQGRRALDQFAAGDQPGRGDSAKEVKKGPGDLVVDGDCLGQPGIGQGQARSTRGEAGQTGCGGRVGHASVTEELLDRTDTERWDAQPDTARPDGGQQPVFLVRAQDEGHVAARLLERLEQGILGVLVHPLGVLDDRDPVTALDRQVGQLGDQVAYTTNGRSA